MLEVRDLNAGYGSIGVLKGVSLQIPAGKIISVIGANGAGKSTLLMTVCGILSAQGGDVLLEGQSIKRLAPEAIVKRGIVQVPEGRRVFSHLTVHENLELGAFARGGISAGEDDLEKVYETFPVLEQRHRQFAGTLSGGEQQMLAIGRGLMARPRVLLLDEPSLGLAPKMAETVFGVIRKINEQGMTIVLVEQNAYMALKLSHAGYVLETGKIVMADSSANLLASPQIRQAYLGI